MNLRAITPLDAKRLMEAGAILIDIREADEHARERIPGAQHVPLSKLDEAAIATQRRKTVIFHCRSGGSHKKQQRRPLGGARQPAGQSCDRQHAGRQRQTAEHLDHAEIGAHVLFRPFISGVVAARDHFGRHSSATTF